MPSVRWSRQRLSALWENGGTGKVEHGGPNRWIIQPEAQMPYKLDGQGVILR